MKQTVGRRRGGRASAGGRHGVDGAEDGGEEIRVGGERIRRRRWTAQVPAAFRPPPTLAVDSTGTGRRRESRKGATWWRRWSFPSASRFPRSVGFLWEGFVAANLVGRAPAPLPFYIAWATGAHQPDGLGAPDQGASRESDLAFGSSCEINPNTRQARYFHPIEGYY